MGLFVSSLVPLRSHLLSIYEILSECVGVSVNQTSAPPSDHDDDREEEDEDDPERSAAT